jgi:chemotaxis protein methyltransferase CheR
MNEILLQKFIDLISQYTGLQIRPQDRQLFSQKLGVRMKSIKMSKPEKYYDLLEYPSPQSQKEWRELILQLTVTESYFLRDKGQFEILQKIILPELIQTKKIAFQTLGIPKSIRLWSAGCSTGEEPYSLAMLVKELLPDWPEWNLLILGTDINEEVMEKARKGIYSDWSFRQVDSVIKNQHFVHKKNEWYISDDLRNMVKFRSNNLIQDPFPNFTDEIYNMDLIICRNVFVYFDTISIAKVINKFYHTLRLGGYLITGHAELHGQHIEYFQTKVFPESVVYQRTEAHLGEVSRVRKALSSLDEMDLFAPGENLLPLDSPLDSHPPEQKILALNNSSQNSNTRSNIYPEKKLNKVPPIANLAAGDIAHKKEFILWEEAQHLFTNKAYREVLKKLDELLKLSPRHFEAYYLQAQVYANIGEYHQANECCQQAIKLNPLSEFPYYLLAHIAEEKGELEQAKKIFKRIIYLDHTALSAYFKLGDIYARELDITRSQKMYKIAWDIVQKLPPDSVLGYPSHLKVREMLNYLEKVLQK